jgi:hypothetical protein
MFEPPKAARVTTSGERAVSEVAGRQSPEIVTEVVASPGHPLDDRLRTRAESAFGHDFSRVRVHSDGRAAESAYRVAASAYTLGDHVVFADGAYRPDTAAGQRLIVHELTHVVQQQGGRPGAIPAFGAPEGHAEREAAAVGERVAGGSPVTVAHRGAAVIARAPDLGDVAGLSNAQLQEEYQSTLSRLGSGEASGPEAAGLASYAQRLRSAIDLRGGVVAQQPTPADLSRQVLNQRGFSSAAPGRGAEVNKVPEIDPAGVGKPLGPGYQTNSVVSVTDQQGKQVATELGQYRGGGSDHAEGQAADALRARLPAGSVRGGRITVAVDQVPCPSCQARLHALAEHLGASSIEAYGPARASLTGAGDVSTKTAARTATVGTREGAGPRPPVRTELLWGETITPRPGPAGSVPPVPETPPATRPRPAPEPAGPVHPEPARPTTAAPEVVRLPKAAEAARGTEPAGGLRRGVEGVAGKAFEFFAVFDVIMMVRKGALETPVGTMVIDPRKYFRYRLKRDLKIDVDQLEGKVIEENGEKFIVVGGMPYPYDEVTHQAKSWETYQEPVEPRS